jgi:hypothetical protein
MTVHYYFSDQLGSASTITDPSGNVPEQYYYYPYGGLASASGSDTNHYLFTGKNATPNPGWITSVPATMRVREPFHDPNLRRSIRNQNECFDHPRQLVACSFMLAACLLALSIMCCWHFTVFGCMRIVKAREVVEQCG